MKKVILSTLVVAALGLPAVSMAQFGLSSVLGGSSSSSSSADLGSSQDALVKDYVAANKNVLIANAYMAEALGLKTEAATAKAQAEALTEGATKGNLQDADKEVSTSSAAILAAMDGKPELDEASKKMFSEGLAYLGKGVVKYVDVAGGAQKLSGEISSASPMALASLDKAVYLVANVPDSMSNLGSALEASVKFAQDAGIPVPDDANDALSAI